MNEVARLEELCVEEPGNIVMGPFGSRIKAENYRASGVPMIRGNNVAGLSFHDDDFVFVSQEFAQGLSGHMAVAGDLLLVHRGSLGAMSIVPYAAQFPQYLVGNSLVRARLDPAKVNPQFVYYFLRSPHGQHEWLKNTSRTGVPAIAQPTTTTRNLEIPTPPRPAQDRIASILSAYDDLIENNRRRIRLLEDMAQLFYREWFVHYRFPGHEDVESVDSEFGPIPEGWEPCKFTDFADVLSGGTPKKSEPTYWSGDIPFFTPKDTQSGFFVLDCAAHVTPLGISKCNSKLFDPRTVFITARGTVGKVAMPTAPMAMNQSCYALKSHGGYSQEWLFLTTQHKVGYLKKNTGGATFDTIIVDTFRLMDVVKPPQDIVARFTDLVGPAMDLMETLEHRNAGLRAARDLLLPRLISGELDVSNWGEAA